MVERQLHAESGFTLSVQTNMQEVINTPRAETAKDDS